MGVQGCGKGTQAKLMCDSYDFVHISIGDQFRWHISNHTKLAAKLQRVIAAGQMAGDDLVEKVVSERLQWHDWNYGFVLDGFPRNFTQAEFLLETYNINGAIHLQVADDIVTKRVLARRVCNSCGLDYNLIHHRPKVEGVCDVCHGKLKAREDDNEAAIVNRLADYHTKTEPIIELFKQVGILVEVDAAQSVELVFEDIKRKIGLPDPPRHMNSRNMVTEFRSREAKG